MPVLMPMNLRQRADSTRRRFLAVTAGAVAYLVWTGIVSAEPASVKAFLGRYKHSGGDKDRVARDKAIDDVVAGMTVLTRGLARDKLKEGSPIAEALALTSKGRSLTVTMDARTYTAPLDGSPVKVKSITGDELKMHFEVGTTLSQVFVGDEKGRVNTFSGGGDSLLIHVRVHAAQLPKDLIYTLHYDKA